MSEANGWKERAADFDRRMDRLTERHEALTQSVELMHRDAEQRQRDWEERHRKLEEDQQKNQKLLAETMEAINSLARIAQAHEKRIEGLEGQ